MKDMNNILLYVDNTIDSAKFYADLLDKQPLDVSPTFALFALDSGVKLGLIARQAVEPAATPVGGSELGFAVDAREVVDAHYEVWSRMGLRIAMPPTQKPFGYTFVALDPDGHRLRVMALTAQ
jgi:predicted enzyme related to lactoylglutathione lyase